MQELQSPLAGVPADYKNAGVAADDMILTVVDIDNVNYPKFESNINYAVWKL